MRGLIRYGVDTKNGRDGRDLRVDVFRGLALWFIFIDHVPGNVLGGLTLRNIALCDATEAFVLLAGYAAGLAYGAVLDRQGWGFAAAQLVRRVGTLYIAHIFLFVVFTAQVGFSAAALDRNVYLDELNLDAFGEQPYQALLQALLLRFQPAFLDILPLYIVLLMLLVPALPLLRRPPVLLLLSVVGYGLARAFGLNLPGWTSSGWFFNPLAWQALFFVGCALGYTPRGAARPFAAIRWHPALAAGCVLLLVLGAVALVAASRRTEWLELLPDGLARMVADVDKTSLHPFRLLSVLALAYLLGHAVPNRAGWLRGRLAAPFVLMGQHGLSVFCSGIFLAFLARLALERSDGWPMQGAANAAGLATMVAVGLVAAWYRLRSRGTPATAARTPAALLAASSDSPIADRLPGHTASPRTPFVIRATWPSLLLLVALAAPLAAPLAAQFAAATQPVPGAANGAANGAAAASCAAPAELMEPIAPLPATARALRARQLRVVVVGSASVLGAGTSGPAAGWPGRLQLWLAARYPGLMLEVTVRGGRGLTAADTAVMIADELARGPAHLVLWQTATVEAVRGIEVDAMVETLNAGLERIRAAGADAVLVDPQFSRFLRANANIEPYRDALRLVAAAHGVALFRRYDLMQHWAEAELIDLERAPREARIATADRLNECLAEAMAGLLTRGVAEARGRLPPRP